MSSTSLSAATLVATKTLRIEELQAGALFLDTKKGKLWRLSDLRRRTPTALLAHRVVDGKARWFLVTDKVITLLV